MARIDTYLVQNLLIENLRVMDFSAPFGTFDATQRRYKFDHLGQFLKEADKIVASKLLEEFNKKEWFHEIAQTTGINTNTFQVPSAWFLMYVLDSNNNRAVYVDQQTFNLMNRDLIKNKLTKGYWTIDNGLVKYIDNVANQFKLVYVNYDQYPLSPAGFEPYVVDYATYLGLRVRNDNPVEAESYLNSFIVRFANLKSEMNYNQLR